MVKVAGGFPSAHRITFAYLEFRLRDLVDSNMIMKRMNVNELRLTFHIMLVYFRLGDRHDLSSDFDGVSQM